MTDNFLDPYNSTGNWYEAWKLLAALVNAIKRIRTLVTSIPLHHPAILARHALTVDHISNGRLELGFCSGVSGETDPVYKMIFINDRAPYERVKGFKEQVEIINNLLRNREINYDGKYYLIKNAYMYPSPIQKSRYSLTITTMGRQMLKIAVQYTGIWNSIGSMEWNTSLKRYSKILMSEINFWISIVIKSDATLNRYLIPFYCLASN